MAILRPEPNPEKEITKRPRVVLIPPPDLPVPAVQGGAVETLLTQLIQENERCGELDLWCASVPDEAAQRAAAGWQRTRMLYVPRPHGHRRYWPMVFIERCLGIAAPYDPWYQKVQLALALERLTPDVIVAEGGNLTQCSAISRMYGRRRCLAHLHGQTTCSPVMDEIYGGVLALSRFIRDDYLKTSALPLKNAYIWHNCVDVHRFCPGPAPAGLRKRLGFTGQDFVVLFCGRLEPDKGIHKLMEALALLPVPHIKLLIVGSPFFGRTQQSSFLRKLEQQARGLGDRVQFTGYIPNEDLPDYYRLADLLISPMLSAVRATPVTSFIVLALVWLSSSRVPVLTGFLMTLPVVFSALTQAVREIDPRLLEVARVFGYGKVGTLRHVVVPAVLPAVVESCLAAIGLCWKAVVAAEVIGVPKLAVGSRLYEAKIYLETDSLLAWTLTIVLLSVLLEKLLRAAAARVMEVRHG